MDKIIRVIRLGTPQDVKDEIRFIIDQLEKYNYALTENAPAKRIFCRFIPSLYKSSNIVISRKDVLLINPGYKINRIDSYSFRIEQKNEGELVNRLRKPNYNTIPEKFNAYDYSGIKTRKDEVDVDDKLVQTKYKSYKYGAKMRRIKFSLSYGDFKLLCKSKCHYCGESHLNSIDRVNDRKGYTKNNCVASCESCSLKRKNMSKTEFKRYLKEKTGKNTYMTHFIKIKGIKPF